VYSSALGRLRSSKGKIQIDDKANGMTITNTVHTGPFQLSFAHDFNEDDHAIRFLELPPELLKQVEEAGPSASFTLKDSDGGMNLHSNGVNSVYSQERRSNSTIFDQECRSTTLHTENATYVIREVQVSNTLILGTPDAINPERWTLMAAESTFLELVRSAPPRLAERVFEFIAGSEYDGNDAVRNLFFVHFFILVHNATHIFWSSTALDYCDVAQ
jgi:hypothetical protein